jgi:4'-phosphopantetheinyl transferase
MRAPTCPTIDVWIADLDALARLRPPLGLSLSKAEVARVGALTSPIEAARAAASRGLLRALLGHRLGIPPAEIGLSEGPFGKPELADPAARLAFNVSNAGGLVAVAISPGTPVGIDVEHELPPGVALPAAVMMPEERAALARMPERRRLESFNRLWVRKEAILKAAGLGVAGRPEEMEVPLGPKPVCRPVRLPDLYGAPATWLLLDLATGVAGAAGAVAVQAARARIVRHVLSETLDAAGRGT